MILKAAVICLALNIYHEARGEPHNGQLAVAHVTINRAKKNKTTICKEVYRKNQFSWTRKKMIKIDKSSKEWLDAKKTALEALRTKDTTHGSLFFFNPKKCGHPASIVTNRKKVKSIGNHDFYANTK